MGRDFEISTPKLRHKASGSSDKMDDDDDDFNLKTWATLHDAALEVLSTPSAHKKAL